MKTSKTCNWTRVAAALAILLGMLNLWPEASPVIAQAGSVTWSVPANLSNTLYGSWHPAIVADHYGDVHVFWTENLAGGSVVQTEEALTPTGDTVFYSRWDGNSWTTPVDILFVPDDPIADFVAVSVDAGNTLHAVWTGQSNFYYSQASARQAASGNGWSKPVVIADNSAQSMWACDVVADADGGLHAVYATRGSDAGVYHVRSDDRGGNNWQAPVKLSGPFDAQERSFSNVQIIQDDVGYLHVVWQTNQADGYGQAVYYARSLDRGNDWSSSIQLAYRDPGEFAVDYPYLVAVGNSGLHLILSDGPRPERFQCVSTDAGETWSAPYHILPDMEGTTGYTVPVVDGAGQMHLIIDMRTRATLVNGIYYTNWRDGGWEQVVPVMVSGSAAHGAHYAAATVRMGNELHVVWNDIGRGEIWHIQGELHSVRQTPAKVVTPPATSTLMSPTALSDIQLTSTPLPPPVGRLVDKIPPRRSTSLHNPLMLSIALTLLLILGTVVWVKAHALRD